MAEQFPTREVGQKKLTFALWFTSHKLLLRKLLISGLIGLSILFYAFSLFGLITIYGLTQTQHNLAMHQLTTNTVDYAALHDVLAAKDLQFSSIFVLSSSGGKRDLAIQVKNPNKDFFVKNITYQYTLNDEVIYEGSSYIYPGEEKYLLAFEQQISSSGAGVNMVVKDIVWQRTNERFNELAELARNFKISNAVYEKATETNAYQSSFTLTNQSIFSYWNVDVFLLQFNGGNVRAASFTTVDQINPKESKDIIVSWLSQFSAQGTVQISADVNILDDDNFMDYEAEIGERR